MALIAELGELFVTTEERPVFDGTGTLITFYLPAGAVFMAAGFASTNWCRVVSHVGNGMMLMWRVRRLL